MAAVSFTDIQVKVIPNASRTAYEGRLEDGTHKIRLQAVPEKGKANKALIQFLAKKLSISRSSIDLLSGETARLKRLRIHGLALEAIIAQLTD